MLIEEPATAAQCASASLDRMIDQCREMAYVVRQLLPMHDARNSRVQSRLRFRDIRRNNHCGSICVDCNVVTMQVELPKLRHVHQDLPMPIAQDAFDPRVTGIQICSRQHHGSRDHKARRSAVERPGRCDSFCGMAVIADVPPPFRSITMTLDWRQSHL